MTGGVGFDRVGPERAGPERAAAQRRGCLGLLAVYGLAAVIAALVWALAWPGSGSREEPSPSPVTTIAPSYTRAPSGLPPVVDEVLARAWNTGRYGCGITGPAVDGLAAALERDIAEAPPPDARSVAARWVAEHCRG